MSRKDLRLYTKQEGNDTIETFVVGNFWFESYRDTVLTLDTCDDCHKWPQMSDLVTIFKHFSCEQPSYMLLQMRYGIRRYSHSHQQVVPSSALKEG